MVIADTSFLRCRAVIARRRGLNRSRPSFPGFGYIEWTVDLWRAVDEAMLVGFEPYWRFMSYSQGQAETLGTLAS